MARRKARIRVERRVQVTTRRTTTTTRTFQQQPPPRPAPRRTEAAGDTRKVRSQTSRALPGGRSPVREVAENLGEVVGEGEREFDVFISHATMTRTISSVHSPGP